MITLSDDPYVSGQVSVCYMRCLIIQSYRVEHAAVDPLAKIRLCEGPLTIAQWRRKFIISEMYVRRRVISRIMPFGACGLWGQNFPPYCLVL